MLHIIPEKAGRIAVLHLHGRLDSANCQTLAIHAARSLAEGCDTLLLDLSPLAYLNSVGFRTLIETQGWAAEDQAALALCGLSGFVRELFDISGMGDTFAIYPSQDSALAALGHSSAAPCAQV